MRLAWSLCVLLAVVHAVAGVRVNIHSASTAAADLSRAVEQLEAEVDSLERAQDQPTDAVNQARATLTVRVAEYQELKRQAAEQKTRAHNAWLKVQQEKTHRDSMKSKHEGALKSIQDAKARLTAAESAATGYSSNPIHAQISNMTATYTRLRAIRPSKEKEKLQITTSLPAVPGLPDEKSIKVNTQKSLSDLKLENDQWFSNYATVKQQLSSLKHQRDTQTQQLRNAVFEARIALRNATSLAAGFQSALSQAQSRLDSAKASHHSLHLQHVQADQKVTAALALAKQAAAAVKRQLEERTRVYTKKLNEAQALENKRSVHAKHREEHYRKVLHRVKHLKARLRSLVERVEKEEKRHGDLLNSSKHAEIALTKDRQGLSTSSDNLVKGRNDLNNYVASMNSSLPLPPH